MVSFSVHLFPIFIFDTFQVHNPKEMDKDGLGWLNKATNELINKKLAGTSI